MLIVKIIFRQKSAEDIINVSFTNVSYCTSINWRPVIEPDFGQVRFLTEEPNESFRSQKFSKLPVIAGITANEFAATVIGSFYLNSF